MINRSRGRPGRAPDPVRRGTRAYDPWLHAPAWGPATFRPTDAAGARPWTPWRDEAGYPGYPSDYPFDGGRPPLPAHRRRPERFQSTLPQRAPAPAPPRGWRRAFDAAPPDDDDRHERRTHDGRAGRGHARRGVPLERPNADREPRFERRRQPPDRRARPRDPEGWRSRGREFVRRFREPLIGIAVAGAMAPLVRGVQQAQTARRGPSGRELQMPERWTGPTEYRPIDESLASRWAGARAEEVRRDIIHGAVMRYDIAPSLAADIYDIAEAEGIEPELAYGLVNTESAFDDRAVSSVGARGLTQIMPRTARWLLPGTNAEDLFDRELNLHMGFGYLRNLIAKYDGSLRLALLAYNRGPGTVDRVLAAGGDPDNGYADKVLSG